MLFSLLSPVFLGACSPWYVLRAGWEEAGILARRQNIEALVSSPTTPVQLKTKLETVVRARNFAKELGLEPKESFTKYSEINREVLVWVLSATPKTSFKPKTWWFPIVGRVPYKGFFSKEDADKEASNLALQGYDTFLRPSPAFSTLGWFNDPILSTTLNQNEEVIVDTVIHEIVHSTVWIPNHVSFNETMANVIAGLATIMFYERQNEDSQSKAQAARKTLETQLRYADHIASLEKELSLVYELCEEVECSPSDQVGKEVLKMREIIFNDAYYRWVQSLDAQQQQKKIGHRTNTLNNAVIVARRLYLDRPELFMELFAKKGNSLDKLIDEMMLIKKNVMKYKRDPYELLKERLHESNC